jgi:hypothetical protein
MASLIFSTPAIPADVAAFAAHHGLTDSLAAVIALTRRVFPHAAIVPCLERDAEEDNQVTIVLEVDVAGLEAAQLVAAQRQWSAGLFSCCPSTQTHLLCLRMV